MSTQPTDTKPPSPSGMRATISGDNRMDRQAPARPMWRYRLTRFVAGLVVRGYSGLKLEAIGRLPPGPAVLCFSHQNWADPLYLIAALPVRPRTYFFGPEQDDMTRGLRNRLMRWVGVTIPYRLGGRGMAPATRRAQALLAAGNWVAIAGEGRIHSGEGVILPLLDGPGYLALRAGVPLVPIAINGTGWLAFRRQVRVRVGPAIGPTAMLGAGPGARAGHPRPAEVAALTDRARRTMLDLAADSVDRPPSRWVGGWLTELFNDWPEGARPPVPPRDGGAGANT